jgi:hypothetical protein
MSDRSHEDAGRVNEDTYFFVGKDSFADLVFNPARQPNLRHIFNKAKQHPVKEFVLAEKPQVKYLCHVTLIESRDKFTPRLAFSIRDDTGRLRALRTAAGEDTYDLKARVDLEDCHDKFWELVSFLRTLDGVEIPEGPFSLVLRDDAEIVEAIVRDRDPSSLKGIVKELLSRGGSLSRQDINQLLRRKEKLQEFEAAMDSDDNEGWWQDSFEENKWIFGYGLNYQVLRQDQPQPYYGGTRVDGLGGQRGDMLTSTSGDVGFTVLVEIKKPRTPLLQGTREIRKGAWSLSKELTDALSQIEANIPSWADSSKQPDNVDRFEKVGVYTVQPKGIVVIGTWGQVKEPRSKRNTFERFRKSIHGVEILTFDELLHRARFIVDQSD